jgi:hypothetical protein
MKIKSSPTNIKSKCYLEQACYERLNPEALKWAKEQVNKFKELGCYIPYGLIRNSAIDKFQENQKLIR